MDCNFVSWFRFFFFFVGGIEGEAQNILSDECVNTRPASDLSSFPPKLGQEEREQWAEEDHQMQQRWPYGVVVNVLDYDIVVTKFELQLRYYVHSRTLTLFHLSLSLSLSLSLTHSLTLSHTHTHTHWPENIQAFRIRLIAAGNKGVHDLF